MINPRNIVKALLFVVCVVLTTGQQWSVDAATSDGKQFFMEQDTVETLVRQWAPLVWLAPGEKFMPGNVNNFLRYVHAEKSVTGTLAVPSKVPEEILELGEEYYYEVDNSWTGEVNGQLPPAQRNKGMFREKKKLHDYVIDLPIGQRSLNWFLVSNDNIDNLLGESSSFVYGQNPNTANVPIYAMISMCGSTEMPPQQNDINYNFNERLDQYNPYIPVTIPAAMKSLRFPYTFEKPKNITKPMSDRLNRGIVEDIVGVRSKRELNATKTLPTKATIATKPPELFTTQRAGRQLNKPERERTVPAKGDWPHFHVTYWMFYPYSQGKTICTISLGPLGRMPIPVLFGMCLGTKRDFGSHVGDWEHMSLFFRGNKEPEEMYVSAHDAGAFYSYERLTGTFDFRSQETRKGILQHPNFPKTVRTSENHPVLFSAQGSHGLWTAPGKHRFVRLPRLFDVNGFGTPWSTWKQIEYSYDIAGDGGAGDGRNGKPGTIGRSIGPEWLRFHGRWGNPKSKCHPLKRIGLNFCEYSDGPTGIPLKKPHFTCQAH